jgi:hypothetical protein
MRKVEEIEAQIRALPREEFDELRSWFLEHDWQAWDKKIEAHAIAGKFDKLIAEAKSEYQSGKAKPF